MTSSTTSTGATDDQLSRSLAGIDIVEPAGAGAVAGEPGALTEDAPARPLTADEFASFLAGCLATGGIVAATLTKNPGFRALAVSDKEIPSFREAATSLHWLAEKYPQYLGWMINPQNKTIQCVVAVGTFGAMKVSVVRAAIQAHQQRPMPAPAATPAEGAARMQ